MALFMLYHPFSGNGRATDLVEQLVNRYPQVTCHLFATQKQDDEKRQVDKILKQFTPEQDQLVIVGGDGTLSKTLSVWPMDLPFAYLPTGSGNDFSRSLGGLSLEEVMVALEDKQVQELTVLVSPCGKQVINSLDLAYAAQAVKLVNGSRLKRVFNKLGCGALIYLLMGLVSLFQTKSVSLQVTCDDQVLDLSDLFFVSVANNRYFGGGVTIWPTSHVTKPTVDVVYAPNRGLLGNLQTLIMVLLGRHQSYPHLHHVEAKSVRVISPEPQLAQIDGDGYELTDLSLTCQTRYCYLPLTARAKNL